MSAAPLQTATASAPGTCGELAQGPCANGTGEAREVMITCPVNRRVTARLSLGPGGGRIHAPADAPRTLRALQALPPERHQDLWLTLDNPLPRGRGMASSTADLCAALAARLRLAGQSVFPEDLARRVLAIEPSDGIMIPGIALFDHREGRVMESLGAPPPLWLLCLDFGGRVDTLGFNARNQPCRNDQAGEAVSEVRAGLAEGDLRLIGSGATASTRARQDRLPHPALEAVQQLAGKTDALGINRAHSGTVLGLLFSEPEQAEAARHRAGKQLTGLLRAECLQLEGGGVTTEDPQSD